MAVWIEERAAIAGGGKARWLEAVRDTRAPALERTRGQRLVWCGSTIGSSGRWPEAVALWELEDFDHYARVCARPDDAQDRRWLEETSSLAPATGHRTLALLPGSPNLEELVRAGVPGVVLSFRTLGEASPEEGLERPGATLLLAAEEVFACRRALVIHAWPSLESLVAGAGSAAGAGRWQETWAFGSPGNPLWPKGRSASGRVW